MVKMLKCRFGILRAKSASAPSPKPTTEAPKASSQLTTALEPKVSKTQATGSARSKITLPLTSKRYYLETNATQWTRKSFLKNKEKRSPSKITCNFTKVLLNRGKVSRKRLSPQRGILSSHLMSRVKPAVNKSETCHPPQQPKVTKYSSSKSEERKKRRVVPAENLSIKS